VNGESRPQAPTDGSSADSASIAQAASLPPLLTTALDARDEVKSLRRVALLALSLAYSPVGMNAAWDACDVYRRACGRACRTQRLGDQDAGGYNVWAGAP
jgi:hypothetical protein